jgi:phosphinothricin acetyltransferase
MISVRDAAENDLRAITEIYNEAILTTTATFDTEPVTEAQQRLWLTEHDARYPVLVAELNGIVVGWASLSRWSGRCGYADTAEISLYVKSEQCGNGIGKKLIVKIIQAGQEAGLHSVLARIAEGNEISVHLHKTVGFELVGVIREVGRKFGRWLDVHLMQKIYP